MIRWLFFDVGFTLADESEVWKRRCREQAEGEEARALGLSDADIYRELEEASRNYLPPFPTMLRRHRFTHAAPYRGELETLYPQAPAVLSQLGEKFQLGVIANQAKGLRDRLREWDILQYFSVVASSAEAGAAKPDPALFRLALSMAGCAPWEAVMIGDRLDNDIFPAKALGMKTVWICQGLGALQTPKGPEYTPDWKIFSLSQLPSIDLTTYESYSRANPVPADARPIRKT